MKNVFTILTLAVAMAVPALPSFADHNGSTTSRSRTESRQSVRESGPYGSTQGFGGTREGQRRQEQAYAQRRAARAGADYSVGYNYRGPNRPR